MPVEEVGFDQPQRSRLTFVGIEIGQSRKLAFLDAIPGKNQPVSYMKRHYIAEEQHGSKYIMCTGGSCCQYPTWNKFDHAYKPQKAKQVYWVPCVYYYSDPETLEAKCGLGVLSMSYYQFQDYTKFVNDCKAMDIDIFKQDVKVSAKKLNNFTVYEYADDRDKTLPRWQTTPEMREQIEEGLKTFAQLIKDEYPPEYSEIEMQKKIAEWNAFKQSKEGIAATMGDGATTMVESASSAQAQVATTQPQAQPQAQTATQPTVQTVASQQVMQQVPEIQVTEISTTTVQQAMLQAQPQTTIQPQPQVVTQQIPQANPVGNENFSLEDLASVITSVQE